MNILPLVKNVIAGDVNSDIKQSISPSAGRIPKGLQRYESSEGWVKKLNNVVYQVLHNLNLVRYKVNSISVMAARHLVNGGILSISISRTVVCKQRREQRFHCILLRLDLMQVKKN